MQIRFCDRRRVSSSSKVVSFFMSLHRDSSRLTKRTVMYDKYFYFESDQSDCEVRNGDDWKPPNQILKRGGKRGRPKLKIEDQSDCEKRNGHDWKPPNQIRKRGGKRGRPKSKIEVPVACKACPCGHSFFNARKNQKVQLSPGDDIRRRTQRVRREKPDYYDALEYDKQIKKSKNRNSECDNDEEGSRKDLAKPKRKKVKKEEEDDDDILATLSPEKQQQCSLILAELNRKMQIVTWKPSD